MTVRMVDCATCQGRKVVEKFQECFKGHWQTEVGTEGMPEWAQAQLRAEVLHRRPDVFRWQTIDCPSCGGRGEYVVEYFTCKIF